MLRKHFGAFVVLFLCSIFLFFKYVAQLFPSLISEDLTLHYHLTGVQLGVIASSYYYTYTVMQVLSGIMVDKYSVKLCAAFAVLSVSIGLLGFAHSNDFVSMCLFRAMMGMGCAFATTLYMKCAAIWTTKKVFMLVSSFLGTATMLGAAFGAKPVASLFDSMGWQPGVWFIGLFGLSLTVCMLLFVRGNDRETNAFKAKVVDILNVIRKPVNGWLLIYSGLTFSPVIILGGIWGVPFLMVKYQASATEVSVLISIMFLGHAFGPPLWTMLSNGLNQKKSLMILANLISFSVLLVLIYGTPGFGMAKLLFFCLGFSVGCFMLSFGICREVNSLVSMGFAVAYMNTGEGLIGSILEPGIGWLLDLVKSTGNAGFTVQNYQTCLALLPACYILSTFAVMMLFRTISMEASEPDLAQGCVKDSSSMGYA